MNLLSHIWCATCITCQPASSLRLYSHMKQSVPCRLEWLFLLDSLKTKHLSSSEDCLLIFRFILSVTNKHVSSAHRWARHYSVISWTDSDSEWKLGAGCSSTLWGIKIATLLIGRITLQNYAIHLDSIFVCCIFCWTVCLCYLAIIGYNEINIHTHTYAYSDSFWH